MRLVHLLDVLLPPHCVACESGVRTQGQLCADCFRSVSFITEPCCRRCGVPFSASSQGGSNGMCPACMDAPPCFGRARAALRYDDAARRLILPFKHADRVELAGVLAQHMVRAGGQLLRSSDVLVPVPVHPRRLLRRRYNQSALLAHAISRLGQRPVLADALRRVRGTVPLGGKTATERAAELAGAIEMRLGRSSAVKGRHVLLIDDVMTSGATANSCAAVLMQAGASAVDVLAAARVPDPRLN
jgi:ComF family protein